MSKELGGYGPTAGTHVGGTGANLNERPDNSKPGGGSHGNSGGQSGGHSGSNSVDQQISAIQNDPKIKQKLTDMLLAARKMVSVK